MGRDTVVALGTHTGRGAKGAFQADYAHVWRLKNGAVTSFHEVADTATIKAAL